MKFGPVRVEDAEGALLAHATTAGDRRFRKAHRLTTEDIAFLKSAGIRDVVAAILAAADLDLNAQGLLGHPGDLVALDDGRLAGAYAARVQEDVLVVAEDVSGAGRLQDGDDLVAEPVLVKGIAGAQQLIDVAHARDRQLQCRGVAVDIGDNAESHSA